MYEKAEFQWVTIFDSIYKEYCILI